MDGRTCRATESPAIIPLVIIDFHTHIFPPHVRERRDDYVQRDDTFAEMYGSPTAKIATAEELLRSMDEAEVEVSVALGFAWRDHQDCVRHNDYLLEAARKSGGRIVPFCTVNLLAGEDAALPHDGDSLLGAMDPLLGSVWIHQAAPPSSAGGVEDSALEGGINATHRGNPAFDTADFRAPPGNLRVDYGLPSANMELLTSGVYWPTRDDPLALLLGASDHRLVYVDLVVPEPATGVLLTVALLVLGASLRARGRHRPSSS